FRRALRVLRKGAHEELIKETFAHGKLSAVRVARPIRLRTGVAPLRAGRRPQEAGKPSHDVSGARRRGGAAEPALGRLLAVGRRWRRGGGRRLSADLAMVRALRNCALLIASVACAAPDSAGKIEGRESELRDAQKIAACAAALDAVSIEAE